MMTKDIEDFDPELDLLDENNSLKEPRQFDMRRLLNPDTKIDRFKCVKSNDTLRNGKCIMEIEMSDCTVKEIDQAVRDTLRLTI